MIGQLRGRLLSKSPPLLILDVNGVGYELEAPMTTFYSLPEVGAEVLLYTCLLVREDAQSLYGFSSPQQKRLFQMLIRISGVGARMALVILSGMDVDAFHQCVKNRDLGQLSSLPGIGKKTAERLIVEMYDRLSGEPAGTSGLSAGHEVQGVASDSPVRDAIAALIALGYKPQEATRRVQAIDASDMNSEQIIREALKASAR